MSKEQSSQEINLEDIEALRQGFNEVTNAQRSEKRKAQAALQEECRQHLKPWSDQINQRLAELDTDLLARDKAIRSACKALIDSNILPVSTVNGINTVMGTVASVEARIQRLHELLRLVDQLAESHDGSRELSWYDKVIENRIGGSLTPVSQVHDAHRKLVDALKEAASSER